MPPPSIQHQIDHLNELCSYYQVNIVYVSDDHKNQVQQLCKALTTTFDWFAHNEQRIKSALAADPKDQQKSNKTSPKTNKSKFAAADTSDKQKDRVKHAATLCADSAFQNYLKWFWNDKGWSFQPSGDPPKIAAHRVRAITKVKSRAAFNKSEKDGRAWDHLFNDFKKWEQFGS